MLVTRKSKGLNDVIVDDFVADESNAASALAFKETINGVASHTGGKDTVECARGATSLDVTKDVDTGIESSFLLDAFAKGVDIRVKLFRDDDDGAFVRIFFSHLP